MLLQSVVLLPVWSLPIKPVKDFVSLSSQALKVCIESKDEIQFMLFSSHLLSDLEVEFFYPFVEPTVN